jgi:hypothetical protein
MSAILTTLPFTRHRDAIERKRARDGIAALNEICARIDATWHVERTISEGVSRRESFWKSDNVWIRFADQRAFYMSIDLPEDYGTAADHVAAFIATPTPDEDRFDDCGDGEWTNLHV